MTRPCHLRYFGITSWLEEPERVDMLSEVPKSLPVSDTHDLVS